MSCRELKYYLYNINNMPQTVSRNDTLKAAYTYLSDGTKVMVRDRADNTSSNGYLYLGSMVFKKTGTSYAFESTDFGGGRIINVNGTLTPYYYATDHLGSVRAITDASGNVTERNDYYPFGESMTTGNTYPTMSVNRWKYNGKETQTTGEVNWLDYGARMYDEVIGRWTKPDPMSEKYFFQSPYVYVRNSPIVYVDPTGMYIEESSQQEWERRKGDVTSRKDYLRNRINKLTAKAKVKGWSAEKLANKIGDKSERIASLNNSLDVMGSLENSSQGYSLNSGALENQTFYNPKTGDVVISYSGTALFVHETTHDGQFETGDIAFDSKTGNTLAQDIYDEVAAYKAQWAYDASTVGGLQSSNDITPSWVQGITKPNGDQPYKPGGSANTGIGPVNINSTRDVLINAYQHLKNILQTYPVNATLKSITPSIYYKK